ncbi:MAG TPA: TIGR03621 family F420-dependent LLM class oxidoreductase [Acidimicrobiales bacterium]|nr:TIGR03621 family F420-dependent LLM class oxidoreductase [Acidimicrobiales bacterium]
MISVSIQGQMKSTSQWLTLARFADVSGFDTLYVADHPGTSPAPFVSLSAAAVVTERIRLGTCVLNAGRWEPFVLASEIATLDVLSGGRLLLGIGAGHTPAEWSMVGLEIPLPVDRVARLVEVVEAVRMLLRGDQVSMSGDYIKMSDALLNVPSPIQTPIPLMVGGNGRRLLTFAAENADVVGVSGLSKTLADGHSHEVDWHSDSLNRTFDLVRSASGARGRNVSIEALVQHVEFTEDREKFASKIAHLIEGASAQDLLTSPFMWIGTPATIVQQLRDFEQRWGISRYVVREDAASQAVEILEMLGSESRVEYPND